MLIEKVNLLGLVEPWILERLADHAYSVECVNPKDLVTHNRLDLGFRTLYLELKDLCPELADEIYQHDLRAQSLGTLVDPDNSAKSDFEIFKSVFEEVSENINKNGFDSHKTLIPVSSSGSILNGGHRLSSALHFGRKVCILRTGLPPICCDYDYFYRRAVPVHIIEFGVLKLLEFTENTYIAFLWSSGEQNWSEAESLFPNVIYKKDLELSFQGSFNLLYQCYRHMDWVGSESNGYRGIQQKRMECFPSSLSARMLIFQDPTGLEGVREIKNKIRGINGIGYSSVHITDTPEEVSRLSQYILNDNSWHFLNHTTDTEVLSFNRLAELRKDMCREAVSPSDVLIDGSFVFEAYGLRKAEDIDVLISDPIDGSKLEGWERHDHELKFHGIDKHHLIYDPLYYFWLEGAKVVSLRQMILFKKRRGEKKDLLDVESAVASLQDNFWKRRIVRIKQSYLYFTIRSRRKIIASAGAVLRSLGLYNMVRSVWHHGREIKQRILGKPLER